VDSEKNRNHSPTRQSSGRLTAAADFNVPGALALAGNAAWMEADKTTLFLALEGRFEGQSCGSKE